MRKSLQRKLLYTASLLFLIQGGFETEMKSNYEIFEKDMFFDRYRYGKIYIGKYAFLKSCLDYYEEGDIFILDQRDRKGNPNMKIYASYLIDDKEVRSEILEVLCRYEDCYPSDWDRSIDSMKLEWFMHNLSYSLHHKRNRTTDVDLDNLDEAKYDNKLLCKILKL